MKRLALLLAFLPFVACDVFDSEKNSLPTEPATCAAPKPEVISASASKLGCSAGACRAQFFADPATASRYRWTFPTGSPRESSNRSVEVTWDEPPRFPATFGYSLAVCSCPAVSDLDGESCRTINGSVTFNSSTDRVSTGSVFQRTDP